MDAAVASVAVVASALTTEAPETVGMDSLEAAEMIAMDSQVGATVETVAPGERRAAMVGLVGVALGVALGRLALKILPTTQTCKPKTPLAVSC